MIFATFLLGERDSHLRRDLILCLPPNLKGCGGEAAVEGARGEETPAEPGRLPPGGVEVEGGVSVTGTGRLTSWVWDLAS